MERGTERDGAGAFRVRAYLGGRMHDVGRAFRAPAGADPAALLKRCALAALPKAEGWRFLIVSVERTSEGEAVATVLDRLARRHMAEGGRDFAAALAATADSARAVLAGGAKDAAHVGRLRAALAGRWR